MAEKTKFLLGERFKNSEGFEFEIIGYCKSNRRRKIKFLSGFESEVLISSINNGKIKDYGQPSLFGIGINGMKKATVHPLYFRWVNMIGRCYFPKHAQFKSYGGKGIIVEEYLKNFKNYLEFVESMEGYELLIQYPDKYQIDKDIKALDRRDYIRENLSIVLNNENLEEENKEKRIKINMINEQGEVINTFDSICEAEEGTGIHKGNIASVVRGERKRAGGFEWEVYYE